MWGMAMFKEGDPIWVEQTDGEPRAAIYVGSDENATWFGGSPAAYVVYPETRDGEEVAIARITRRDGDAA
jgi:hypothetical protein